MALSLVQGLIIDGNDHDSRRRRKRPGKKKSPVEGEVFDPVQTGGDPLRLIEAKPNAGNKTSRNEDGSEQQCSRLAFNSHLLAEASEKRAHPCLSTLLLGDGRVARRDVDPLPCREQDVFVKAAVRDCDRTIEHERGSLRGLDFHRPFGPPNRSNCERGQNLKLVLLTGWMKLDQ
jgi:hypothetical protein